MVQCKRDINLDCSDKPKNITDSAVRNVELFILFYCQRVSHGARTENYDCNSFSAYTHICRRLGFVLKLGSQLGKPLFHNLNYVSPWLWHEFSSSSYDNTETLSHGCRGNETQIEEICISTATVLEEI